MDTHNPGKAQLPRIDDDLGSLEPAALWSAFLWLCTIPHPSHHEDALAEALFARAKGEGLKAWRDEAGNLIVKKPATPGFENRPGLILQAHLDMVPQVEVGTAHDFLRDPIRPRLDPSDQGWLRATGTTLGADNGIGVAAALAILEDPALRHGPLEGLFTLNEEDGMSGARGLKAGSLEGTVLLNLDSEEEEDICVGCSGGYRFAFHVEAPLQKLVSTESCFEVGVAGLAGGHSAADIDRGRGNALIILAELVLAGRKAAKNLRLALVEGGNAANVIPREARALVCLPSGEAEAFSAALRARAEEFRSVLGAADPGFRFDLKPAEEILSAALTTADSERVLVTIAKAPGGVRAMSEEIPGLVRLSSNLGSLRSSRSSNDTLLIEGITLARGERDSEKEKYAAELRGYYEAAGASTEILSYYAAWTPDLASPLLEHVKRHYRSYYGREPGVKATHGGLECGLFRGAFPKWDMISIGPSIRYPHSPAEAVNIASVGRFWGFLRELIEDFPPMQA